MKLNNLSRNPIYTDLFFYFLLALVTATLFFNVLDNFWIYDDPYILRHVIEHNPWEYFLNPQVWAELSIRNLTPWLSFSFDIDYSLFGLNPSLFYLHHVLSIWLTAVLLYITLKLWMPPLFSLFACIIFLISAPTAASAEMLMVRHYIEGLMFSLLALYFYTKALRNLSYVHSFISAAFYMIAMSAKELYVPIIALMISLPESQIRKRLFYAIPSALALLTYLLWRHWMIGSIIGGAGGESAISLYKGGQAFILLMRNIYTSIIMFSGGTDINAWMHPIIAGIIAIILSLSCYLLLRDRKYSVLFFWIIFTLAIYSVPFAAFHLFFIQNDFASYRVVFFISFGIAVMCSASISYLYSYSCQMSSNKKRLAAKTSLIITALLLTVLLIINSSTWIANKREYIIKPLSIEGRFFMDAQKDTLLIANDPLNSGTHYFENLEFIRSRFFHSEPPSVAYSGFALLNSKDDNSIIWNKVVKYDKTSGLMSDYSNAFYIERAAILSRIVELPLHVRARIHHGSIEIQLGPYDTGRYFLLAGHKPDLYRMVLDFGNTRQLSTRLYTKVYFYGRFGWESPEGSLTLSPMWLIDLSGSYEISWHR